MLAYLPREGCEERCPGCAHRAMSAHESQTRKRSRLKQQFAPWWNKLSGVEAVGEEGRWSYRNKVCLSAAWNTEGWQFGLILRRELIAIPRCPVHSAQVREAVWLLARFLPPKPVFPLAFYVQSGAQLTLVLKTHRMPDSEWLNQNLRRNLGRIGMDGLWLHLHPSAGRRLFTKKGWHLIWGKPRSKDINGLIYGPSAFQQLIPALYGRALDEAQAFLAPSRNSPVIDLYCGLGTSLVRWLSRGAPTVGVELSGEAVECAQRNAPQATVLRGKCADRIPQLKEWIRENAESTDQILLYVNPPRTGLEPEVVNWVSNDFRPERMAYLSCNALTLRRDLDLLNGAHYQIEQITPYDFFPQTHHMETLVLLKRMR